MWLGLRNDRSGLQETGLAYESVDHCESGKGKHTPMVEFKGV